MKLQIDRASFVIAALLIAFSSECTAWASAKDQSAAHRDFLLLCAGCHGEDARGNGPDAKNLTKVPPDLTQISKRAAGKFDEKAVFDWIIGLNMPAPHGTREMPIWGDWLIDETLEDSTSLEAADAAAKEVEDRVRALVKYLKTLQR